VVIPLYMHIVIILAALTGSFLLGILVAGRRLTGWDEAGVEMRLPELSREEIRQLFNSGDNKEHVAAQLQAMADLLPALQANIQDVSKETEQAALTLANVLSRVYSGDQAEREKAVQEGIVALQFQDIVRQKMEHVVQILEDFTRILQNREHDNIDIGSRAEGLYTTAAERQNHRQALAGSVRAMKKTGEADFVRTDQKERQEKSQAYAGQELGENVELF